MLERVFQMSSDLAITVENICKDFHIYENPSDRLKQFFLPALQKVLHIKPKEYFTNYSALKNVSFNINKGETVGIVGKNGAGKSTLLQIICGTLNPSQGKVTINGRIAALLELGSGFNPEYTGKENVYLNAAILGLKKSDIDSKYKDITNFADIGEFIDQPLKTYSSGMVVRLAFAVSINVDPDILIIDEALSVGDELFQRKCFTKLEEIKKRGATILFVSHSGATVVNLCDRAILIDDGEMILNGKPKNVVGLYQKLLYAQPSTRQNIRENIKRSLNGEVKESNQEDTLKKNGNLNIELLNSIQESFDPNLVPSNTIEYANEGAEISDPHISLDGFGRVNNLVIGQEYRYRYTVSFHEDCHDVLFGMLIKTVSGIELGGAKTAANQSSSIALIPNGTKLFVEYIFKCNLVPGVYFLNAGVSGAKSGSETYLHRLLDAVVFRVLPEKDLLVTGLVSFDIQHQIYFDKNP